MTINGDLIIADSADKVSLDNVKVTGRIVIRGGADAVGIKNTTTGKGVLVSSPNGAGGDLGIGRQRRHCDREVRSVPVRLGK